MSRGDIRANLGITLSASAALPIDAPYAVDTLSILNLCLCFYFCRVQHGGEYYIYCVWLYLGSREYWLFAKFLNGCV